MDNHRKLTASLLPLARNWRQAVNVALQPFGLSESFAAPLIYLGRAGGGLCQNELAERSGIGGPALVRVVDKLTAMELVTRQVDGEDKRLRRLFLTPKGEALARRMEEALDRLRTVMLADVSEDDIATFLSVLDRLNAAMHRLAQSAPALDETAEDDV